MARRPPAIHMITNSRALTPAGAEAITTHAARAALEGAPDAQLVLRGDSTLRGHVLEEYRGVRAVVGCGRPPVLLLVPALPAAGRVTREGTHFVSRGGRTVPLHETEFAHDGHFRYHSARLIEWAHERSGGWFAAERGTEVPLAALRTPGSGAVADALARAWRSAGPAVCAPDAESVEDLELIAAGLREARSDGVAVIVRCAPTFAGVLSGALASGLAAPPAPEGGILIVCGSYVQGTTRQLAHLAASHGAPAIELDPLVLAGSGAPAEAAIAEAAARARAELARTGLAVVATARERPEGTHDLDSGMRIARNLAGVVRAVGPGPGVVVAKGGITSAITMQSGLGADSAWVAGPLLPGVALWRVSAEGREVAYVVVPGNVGDDALLSDLIDLLEAGVSRR
jgi:uncharacterized protein YgbK (DUF1537 family)